MFNSSEVTRPTMSNHSPLQNESIGPTSPETESSRRTFHTVLRSIEGPTRFVSFWIAIALPFVYLPLLARGLGDPSVTITFVALLLLNVVTLYLGHDYNQS